MSQKIEKIYFNMLQQWLLFSVIVFLHSTCFASNVQITSERLNLFDESRDRSIPVEIYTKETLEDGPMVGKIPVVIINHGHGIKNTEYSFIANALAEKGYFVISIQHQLPNDPEPVRKNTIFETRKPGWECGVQNILFTLSTIMRMVEDLNFDDITLIGHSGGGDISMLFTSLHPELVSRVISLDSLRFPFSINMQVEPINKIDSNGNVVDELGAKPNEAGELQKKILKAHRDKVHILTLRATDTEADEGVLPESGAAIITIKNAKHMDMCDRGSEEVKQEIMARISEFLEKTSNERKF